MIEIDNAPWFVAADVIRLLYGTTNGHAWAYNVVDDGEKSKVDRNYFEGRGGKPMVIVTESGLYKLIMRSDKPEAKAFQDWVTGTVLPSIRKEGGISSFRMMIGLMASEALEGTLESLDGFT